MKERQASFRENKGENAMQADRLSCSKVWMEQSSPFKDTCTKIHGQEAIDDAGKIARDQMTKYFLCYAEEYDFYLRADASGVSKFLTRGETKADLCFQKKINKTKQKL